MSTVDMLNNAKRAKNDEFYTKMYVIEDELKDIIKIFLMIK